jgi:PAS domain S-box-containing protein
MTACSGFVVAYSLARFGAIRLAGYAVVSACVVGAYLAALDEPQVLPFMNTGAVIASVVLTLRASMFFALAIGLGPVLYSIQVPSYSYGDLAYSQGVNIILPALLLLVGWYRGQLVKERDLRDARFAELVRSSPDGILYVDANDLVITCNPAIEALWGQPAFELLGQTLAALGLEDVVPEDRAKWSGPQLHSRELMRSVGSHCRVECLVQLVDDPLVGRGAQIMIRDVDERLRAKDAQEALERQLHDARRLESIGRLAGGIAHDINNQLTVILGSTNLLLTEDPKNELLNAVETAADHSGRLIGQLLTFARDQPIRESVLDVNELLVEFRSVLKTLIRDDVTLELELCNASTSVLADATNLEQVVVNLVANGSDSMPEGGHLRVRTAVEVISNDAEDGGGLPAGRYVCLEVQDEGVGIDSETLSKMYEPFFTTKNVGEGTGLGLATVYSVVQRSGGAVVATSNPGEGTNFRVLLPWRQPEKISDSEIPLDIHIDWSALDVIVVDDQHLVGEMVVRVLEELGSTATFFESAFAAIAHFERGDVRFDLLISDVIMPEISGPQLAGRLRGLQDDLTVLFASGYPYREDLKGEQLLSKPFTPKQLVGAMTQVLANH